MQIIQGIRDKGAAIVIVVIALSLIGFILMDAKQGSSRMGSNSSSVGKINGSSVDDADFRKRVNTQVDQEEQRSGQKPNAARIAQIREDVWNTIVAERVFFAEADKLGIDFTAKELSAILSSNDPENPLMQDRQMLDSATGKLDLNKLKQAFANIKKMPADQKELFDAQVTNPQRITSVSTKYMALLNASAYYPTWMEEREGKQNKDFAQVSYVSVPYSVISDSAVKVEKADIEKYIEQNKNMFKQEAGRMISYVTFSQLPNAEDSARTKDVLNNLKESFAAETNIKSFLARNTSSIEYDSNYLPKSKILNSGMDSITRSAIGTVVGPYIDKNNYVMARLLGTKIIPDSVRSRHILVATIDPQTRQPIMEDSVAKKLADSIFAAVKGGADFSALAKKYSSDGSKDKGGDLGTYGYGAMVPEFNDYSFNNPVGSKGLVHTMFGYHIMEILSVKGGSPAYKIAYMAKEIIPSETTINKASLDATKLAADKDPKKFDTSALKKLGLTKTTVPALIKENDGSVGMLQDARLLVRWAFEAKKGDISDPFNMGDQFVVATVDNILKEGLQDVQTAKPRAEAAIRIQKKGEEILKKLGNNPTLESAAAAYSLKDTTTGADSSIVYSTRIINGIGMEPKLIGAFFNKENQTKVAAPLVGKSGVYVFKVNSIGTKAAETPEQLAQRRTQGTAQLRNQATSNWFDGLKNQATIKDSRSKFY